jgi:hypothetical protein
MVNQKDNETRTQYLLRVLGVYMFKYGYDTIQYDDTECDGICLYDDIRTELEGASAGVPFPENEEQAVAMAIVGTQWLKENAPHRLTPSQDSV